MKFKYSSEKLVRALKTKRIIDLDNDIRAAAKKIGISPATLSRIENGKPPDITTLASCCYWTGVSLYDCFVPTKKQSIK